VAKRGKVRFQRSSPVSHRALGCVSGQVSERERPMQCKPRLDCTAIFRISRCNTNHSNYRQRHECRIFAMCTAVGYSRLGIMHDLGSPSRAVLNGRISSQLLYWYTSQRHLFKCKGYQHVHRALILNLVPLLPILQCPFPFGNIF
jgi:hypothetical protein